MQKDNKPQQNNNIDNSANILDLLYKYLSYWKWFVISIVVCLLIAFIYMKKTSPVYSRTLSVLIKDNSKDGNQINSELDEFKDMGFFKSNININNELSIMKSPVLMKEVVKRLNLDKTYTMRDGLRTVDLYKKNPVEVLLSRNDENNDFQFDIKLTSNNKFELTDFMINSDNNDNDVVGSFYIPLNTPVGTIIIEPTTVSLSQYINKTIRFTKSNLQIVTDDYNTKLEGSLQNDKSTRDKSTIINLTMKNTSPKRAEDILNTLIQVYNISWIKDKNQIAVGTSQFINGRLKVIERELNEVDNNISNFKSKNLIPDVDAASEMFMDETSANKEKLLELDNQLSVAQFIYKYIQSNKNDNKLLPANEGIANANVEQQIEDYNLLLLQRNNLIKNSGESNPLIKDMNRSIASMHQAITRSVYNLIATLNEQVGNLQSNESQTKKEIASNPKQARYLLSVERQQKVKEQLYLYLLQKREENELSKAFTAYNTRIISPPAGPDLPTFPEGTKVYLLAFVLSLLIPVVIINIREKFLDTFIHGKEDLKQLTLPFVGEIPLIDGEKKKFSFGMKKKTTGNNIKIVVKEKNRDSINEAFRIVRTNIDFMTHQLRTSNKVLMFTSFNADSGKTFISINLALSMAINGRHVLIVDLDLRKASLSKVVKSPKKGISNYLGEQIDNLDEIIVKDTLHKNLDVIPVGTIPPDPTELLSSNRLAELISTLQQKYDYILLDCPPTNIVADTSIISKVADITIFIARCGKLDRRLVPEIENMYKEQKFNRLAMILNAIEFNSRYGYHKYGYHKYGSHYYYYDQYSEK
jgi:tyrosine-protein kinase Etk/Wzc